MRTGLFSCVALCWFCGWVPCSAGAQESLREERIARTTWHSAVVPGWGQVNNGKWWKVPIVYGALGVSGYFIQTEGAQYKEYRDGYRAMTDDDPTTVYATPYDAQEILDRRDFHRSNLEQSVLTFAALWGAQVIDAHVDAQLLGFDVSEDLTWVPGSGPVLGVRLTRSVFRPSPSSNRLFLVR